MTEELAPLKPLCIRRSAKRWAAKLERARVSKRKRQAPRRLARPLALSLALEFDSLPPGDPQRDEILREDFETETRRLANARPRGAAPLLKLFASRRYGKIEEQLVKRGIPLPAGLPGRKNFIERLIQGKTLRDVRINVASGDVEKATPK